MFISRTEIYCRQDSLLPACAYQITAIFTHHLDEIGVHFSPEILALCNSAALSACTFDPSRRGIRVFAIIVASCRDLPDDINIVKSKASLKDPVVSADCMNQLTYFTDQDHIMNTVPQTHLLVKLTTAVLVGRLESKFCQSACTSTNDAVANLWQ
jgi:hypothetical protein